jgi:PIN domain nuclease of toxin-antitoxin system
MDLGLARASTGARSYRSEKAVTVLLDTHFIIWLVLKSRQLSKFPWLERYRPWGISPVSVLEIQYLSEVGRIKVRNPEFTETVLGDQRFLIDEALLLSLVRHALDLSWTREPFDRLLIAHSAARRVPLCTMDRMIRAHYSLLVTELRH